MKRVMQQQELDMDEDPQAAYVDLDDPNNEIIDESCLPEINNDDDDYDNENEEETTGTGNGTTQKKRTAAGVHFKEGEVNENEENNENENEGEEGEGEEGEEEMAGEDLNDIPDREPERDDAICVFHTPDAQPVHSVAVHPRDGNLFAAGGESDSIHILRVSYNNNNINNNNNTTNTDINNNTEGSVGSVRVVAALRGCHTDTVAAVAFSPDGTMLACGGVDGVITIWSTTTWLKQDQNDQNNKENKEEQKEKELCGLSSEVLSLLWHPTSRVLVATAADGQAAMWNAISGSLAVYFSGHCGPVNCAVWARRFKRIVTGGGDGDVMVFAPRTGEAETRVAKGLSPDRAPVTTLCCLGCSTPNNTTNHMNSNSNSNNGQDVMEEEDDVDDRCVVGCEDGSMHVIALRSGRAVATLQETHSQAIESLRVTDRDTTPRLLLSASCDCKVAVWGVIDLTVRVVIHVGESVIPARWMRGHVLLAGCSDGEVRVWDGRATQQAPSVEFMGHRRMILDLAVQENNNNNNTSNNSSLIATGSDDGTVRFFLLPPLV